MHATMKINLLALALFLRSTANASPFAAPRAIVESPLDPWVSVDASGTPVATITPVLTTINGVETTLSPAPEILTATTTSAAGDSKATATDVPTSTGGGSYLVCHNMDGDFAPFCKPDNGSEIYVGETYYVTWDTTYLSDQNSSVLIQGDYVNATGGGEQAFHSEFTPNTFGSIALTIDEIWLQSKSSNNITLFFSSLSASFESSNSQKRIQGPTLMITHRKADVYRQEPAKAPKGQSLYIALPTVFGFILLCVVGGFFWNRKARKIGLGNVMGRKKGYGTGKSRAQRMGLGKKGIQLQDQELSSGAEFKEGMSSGTRVHARTNSEALGSMAGTPTEDRSNAFREEIKRQDQNRF